MSVDPATGRVAPVRVHRRQFVIGPAPLLARRDWRSRELGRGIYLSSCPTLPIEDRDDGILLGIAIRPTSARTSWAGRWVFLTQDKRLELDASGLLGCFYRRLGGSVWVSSSPAILRAIDPELPPANPPLDPDDWTRDWYPPPRSGIASVGTLLPSQVLHLRSGDVVPRSLLPEPTDRPSQEILDDLARLLVDLATGAAERYPELWVSLSGGMDSRLVLAATHAAGLSVTVYTNDKPGMITKADRTLPPRLARALRLRHRLIRPGPSDERRQMLFDVHTASHTFDTERRYVARRHWDQIPPTALVLGGNTWEVGRCAHHTQFGETLPDDSSDLGIWLREWIAWARATPQPGLDWRDRFHIEQKLTGWLSAIEQAIDISGRQRIHLGNCTDVFTHLLSLPEDVRRTGSHQLELIRMLAPELTQFPVNAPERIASRLRRRLRPVSS
jgi:hypothetical protein